MYDGPHQERAPVQKATQVKATVLSMKDLFLARLLQNKEEKRQ